MSLVNATSLAQVLEQLAGGARPVAGGSDLVVGARQGKAALPMRLVAIDRVAELRDVHISDAGVRLGALVNHATIERHAHIVEHYTALADGSALVGSPATRNVGTIGGNVMNGSPAMDTGSPLVVFGAEVELASVRGHRRVPIGELWIGPGKTTAQADELCVAVDLPARAAQSGSAYVRLEYRRAMEIAVVGAAASVVLADDGSIGEVSVALTAVAPTILAVTGLGAGSVADVAAAAASAAAAQSTPISDLRASDAYRRHTIGVMASRAVYAAARRAAGELIGVPVNRSPLFTTLAGVAS
jgi:CO/xanthine dehydrogenase FAD-binding subunit